MKSIATEITKVFNHCVNFYGKMINASLKTETMIREEMEKKETASAIDNAKALLKSKSTRPLHHPYALQESTPIDTKTLKTMFNVPKTASKQIFRARYCKRCGDKRENHPTRCISNYYNLY